MDFKDDHVIGLMYGSLKAFSVGQPMETVAISLLWTQTDNGAGVDIYQINESLSYLMRLHHSTGIIKGT